jgi:hypothetical protein
MAKIQLIITTYNRPEMLLALLMQISEQGHDHDIRILIVDDHSSTDYSEAIDFLKEKYPIQGTFFTMEEHHGKTDYWKLENFAFSIMRKRNFDYLMQLPDDIGLTEGFFDKAIAAWENLPDRSRACLNLLNDYGRYGKSFWTAVKTEEFDFRGYGYLRTGWIDLCYISQRHFLELLDYSVHPVDHSWSGREGMSSGVGRQLSQRLVARGASIYQVKRSLVIHGEHLSVMHPEHRKETPLVTNHQPDHITAGLATFEGRETSLKETVASILPQVDELHVYVNELEHIPECLLDQKITVFRSQDLMGDLGDAGKFYTADEVKGYYFTIDDDLIYPFDYVQQMIGAIERYRRKAVVSLHGRVFMRQPLASYYTADARMFSCLRMVASDVSAHVIGTGVMAYHTDLLRFSVDECRYTNMGDIWFSKFCEERNIKRVILKHEAGWIRNSSKYDQDGSIFNNHIYDDRVQTRISNQVNWKFPIVL